MSKKGNSQGDISSNEKNEDDELVVVKKSTIPEAGKGLFAAKDIPKDTFITYYSGLILKDFPDDNPLYAFELRIPTKKKSGIYIDGSVPQSPDHFGHLINHYRKGVNVRVSYDSNVRRNPKRLIKFFTTREIKKGEEFFWDYGDDYWSDKPKPTRPKKSKTKRRK